MKALFLSALLLVGAVGVAWGQKPDEVYYNMHPEQIRLARVVLWTPQVIWAVLVACLLAGLVVGLRRRPRLWWLQVLPYLLVGLAVAAQWWLWVASFSHGTAPRASLVATFQESATPSFWALGGLAVLHALLLVSLRSQQRSPSYFPAAPARPR